MFEHLRLRKRNTYREYLAMLRQLFPKGIAWNWPLEYYDFLQPTGILSRENFGAASIFGSRVILPIGILSMQEVGEPFLSQEIGFSVFDDFESGTIESFWNSAFANNWSVREQQGQKVAYSNARDDDLFPQSGQSIRGNFDTKFQLVIGSQPSGNKSLRIDIFDGATQIYGLQIHDAILSTYIASVHTAIGPKFVLPLTVTLRMIRSGGHLYSFYNDDPLGGEAGSWIREDTWATPGAGLAFSGDCRLRIDGDSEWGGFGFISITGDELV